MNNNLFKITQDINLESISNQIRYLTNSADIKADDCIFVMIDIQEKFFTVIDNINEVIENATILNKASEILNIPLVITEQYPKGLGITIKNIFQPEKSIKLEKTLFSIFNSGFESILENYKEKNGEKPVLVLYGIETHICVTQSVLDAIKKAYHVIIVADAVSSRKAYSKEIALKLFSDKGVEIVTTEMLLFRFLKDAKHPKFKEISNLIK